LNARKLLLATESLLGCLKLKGLFLLLSIIIFNILFLVNVVILLLLLLLLLLLVADFNQLSVTLSRQ
jgi:hypothetical protein